MHCISFWIPKQWHHQISTWLTPLPPLKKNDIEPQKTGVFGNSNQTNIESKWWFKKKTKHRTPLQKKRLLIRKPTIFKTPSRGGGYCLSTTEVVDSIESQSLASKTTFPSHLLDLVVSLRAYLRDDAWIFVFFLWLGCIEMMCWWCIGDLLVIYWWSIDVWLYWRCLF